jgi:predicted dienelactone hydrolase
VGCTSKPHDDAPLVLFSPAQGTPRLYYSLLVSHVPSYGFTVIMMDHPYDADVVEFPDGSYIREATSNATTIPEIIAMATGEVDVRVQDTSFVLDQLNNKSVIHHLIPGRGCAPDPNSVAMFGHSLGGATAAAAMVNETRIKGGLNLDGAILNCSDVLELGLDRPFLLFGHQNNTRFYNGTTEAADYSAETWSDFWSVLTMETRA